MNERATRGASVTSTENGWRLGIQKGDSSSYRDAQLDDYSQLPRHRFPHRTLKPQPACADLKHFPRWDMGLWACGTIHLDCRLGLAEIHFVCLHCRMQSGFFMHRKQNYLSFTDDKPAQGFLAQTFRSPKFHPLLILAGLTLPFSPLRETARKLLSKVINEDCSRSQCGCHSMAQIQARVESEARAILCG